MTTASLNYLSKARSIFPNYSIYQIRDFGLEKEKNQLQNLTPRSQFQYGAKIAIITNLATLLFKETMNWIATELNGADFQFFADRVIVESYKGALFYPILLAPVIEEIFFRGLLQNGIRKFQEKIQNTPSSDTSKSQILASPTAAIILSSLFFSTYHAPWDISIPVSPKKSFSIRYPGNHLQALSHLYYIPYAVLHYTTGNQIWAPLGFHIGTNGTIFGILNTALKHPISLPSLPGITQYTVTVLTRAIITTTMTAGAVTALGIIAIALAKVLRKEPSKKDLEL